MEKLSDRFAYLLNSKGYSRYRVAKETGISQSTFTHILAGRTSTMTKEVAQKLADYFHVNLLWLETGRGEMLPKLL